MDGVRDNVIIARPFENDHRIFGVWHMYFDVTFVIAACILMLTVLVIYVAHRYRCTRVCVGVWTIVFHDTSDVPHNTKECCISLCNFIVGDNFIVVDQLASLWTCKHVYHRRCIARALARNPTYPICWGILTDGDNWVWHPEDGTRMISFSFFFFSFFCFTVFYVNSLFWLCLYI